MDPRRTVVLLLGPASQPDGGIDAAEPLRGTAMAMGLEVVEAPIPASPGEVAALLATSPDAGLLLATTEDPRPALSVALQLGRPTLLAAAPGEWCEGSDVDQLLAAFEADRVPLGGWLPARFDAGTRTLDAALGDDRCGGVVASRLVRLAQSDPAPLHDLIDLALRWHGDRPTSVHSVATGDGRSGSCVSLRFADGAGALLESGRSGAVPASGYSETLVIGRTRTIELSWDPLHDAIVRPSGILAARPATPTDAGRDLLSSWMTTLHGGPTEVDASALVTALRIARAAERSARTGHAIDLPDARRDR